MELNQINNGTLLEEKKLEINKTKELCKEDIYSESHSDSEDIDSELFEAEIETHLNDKDSFESMTELESKKTEVEENSKTLDIDTIINQINKNDSMIEFNKISDEELDVEISKNMAISHKEWAANEYLENKNDIEITQDEISHLSLLDEHITKPVINEKLIKNYCSRSRTYNQDTYKFAASLVLIANKCFKSNTINGTLNSILLKHGIILNMSKKTFTYGSVLNNVFPKPIVEFIVHEYGFVKKVN